MVPFGSNWGELVRRDRIESDFMPRKASIIRDIERATLPNGIRVVTEQMPHVRSVSVGIWICTGSREEADHQTGLSHFIEHMVFKGTKNRSAEQIARSVDSI